MASRATAYRPAAISDRRDAARVDAQVMRAALRSATNEPTPATLVEISIYGCRIACDLTPEVDEPVWLRLGGSLPIAAHVVWSEGTRIGCRFDAPIGRPLLRSLTIPDG